MWDSRPGFPPRAARPLLLRRRSTGRVWSFRTCIPIVLHPRGGRTAANARPSSKAGAAAILPVEVLHALLSESLQLGLVRRP